jgi:hypothetical protein
MTDSEPIETTKDLNLDIPKAITDIVNSGRNFLGIDPAWHIYLKMDEKPAGSDRFAASTNADASYLNAHLVFAPCVEAEVHKIKVQYVWHELLHVSLAELDAVIDEMMTFLPKKIRKLLKFKSEEMVERFIQRTVRAILDNPEILQECVVTFQEKSDSQR